MANETKIETLVKKRISTADAASQGFESALKQIANKWRRILDEYMATRTVAPRAAAAQQVVTLQTNLRGQLNQIGYQHLYKKFVSGYDEQDILNRQITSQLPRQDVLLRTTVPQETLSRLRDLDMTMFEEIGSNAVTELTKQITLNTIAGASRTDIIRAMDNVLTGDFAGKGAVYADTAVRIYDRQSAFAHYEGLIDKFKYFGPRDIRNRPFCAEHVNHIYTQAEIDKMVNDLDQPARIWCGGYRCRHVWMPQAGK